MWLLLFNGKSHTYLVDQSLSILNLIAYQLPIYFADKTVIRLTGVCKKKKKTKK